MISKKIFSIVAAALMSRGAICMTNKIPADALITKSSSPSWYLQGNCNDIDMSTECSLSGSRGPGDVIQFDLNSSELLQTIYMA